jgi:DNA-binding NarL/FixJ family response regulator
VAPKGIGRPLAASEAQQRQVLVMRKEGKSLRTIAAKTSLSPRTVRTIVGKVEGPTAPPSAPTSFASWN